MEVPILSKWRNREISSSIFWKKKSSRCCLISKILLETKRAIVALSITSLIMLNKTVSIPQSDTHRYSAIFLYIQFDGKCSGTVIQVESLLAEIVFHNKWQWPAMIEEDISMIVAYCCLLTEDPRTILFTAFCP